MKKTLPFVIVLAIGSTCALNVSADAPSTQYAAFNRNDQRITDNNTKLVWERGISGPLSDPNIDPYCPLPTRLPTVKELLSLVDEIPNETYDSSQGRTVKVHIDLNAFDLQSGFVRVDKPFCTQTKGTDGSRFVVDFSTGAALTSTGACYARCVQYTGPL